MLSRENLSHAKGVLQYFCNQLYLQRDLLSLITFGNNQVSVIYDAKPAPKSFDEQLNNIKGGGGTPFINALQELKKHAKQHRQLEQTVTILTDGRMQISETLPDLEMPIRLIDMETTAVKLSQVKKLAERLGGEYFNIDTLRKF